MNNEFDPVALRRVCDATLDSSSSLPVEDLAQMRRKMYALVDSMQLLLQEATQENVIRVPGQSIQLLPGERYAGTLLDTAGAAVHHVVVLAASPSVPKTWTDARSWAESLGGCLPTVSEQALIYANCSIPLSAEWYWSDEGTEGVSATAFNYSTCTLGIRSKDARCRALAVRRVRAAASAGELLPILKPTATPPPAADRLRAYSEGKKGKSGKEFVVRYLLAREHLAGLQAEGLVGDVDEVVGLQDCTDHVVASFRRESYIGSAQ